MQEEKKDLCAKEKSSNKQTDEKSVCSQGACTRIKKVIFNKEIKSNNFGNLIPKSSGSHIKKSCTFQNGAGCSSWFLCSSGTSSCLLNDVLSSEFNSTKEVDKTLVKDGSFSKESDFIIYNEKKNLENSEENDNSSGNEGDETFSGDDCCIYTYKGDQFADLPNSLFPIQMKENEENHKEGICRQGNNLMDEERSNPGSSPEMDYLEMDFDPGPSLEHDLEGEEFDSVEKQAANKSPAPDLPSEPNINLFEDINNLKIESTLTNQEPIPGPSYESFYLNLPKSNNIQNCFNNNRINGNYDNIRTKKLLGNCKQGHCSFDKNGINCDFELNENLDCKNDESTSKSLLIENRRLEKINSLTEKKERNINIRENESDLKTPFDGIMLWSEQEAISNQVFVSSEVSCGAAAVINVMLVLKLRFSIDNVKEGLCSRLKTDSASIPQYLVSRSFAGVAHENLIRGIHHASHGTLYAKFFQMYPKRDIVLSRWLCHWMKLGAVPIATMNVQRDLSTESSTNDTRHHQMVYGVSSKGIHLTNPLECLQNEELWNRLTSPSVLNIKRQEIVSRWSPNTNLKPLMYQSDDRWKTMNVLGQVVNMIRESPDPSAQGKFLTQHISIPASSGITLVISRDSPGYEELVLTPELPLCSQAKIK